MEKTMTKREFLTAVAQMNGADMMATGTVEALAEYAKSALEKMEADAEKRKGHKTEKQKAEVAAKDARAIEVAKTYLGAEAKTATDVMELMNARIDEDGVEPYKVQAVSAMLRRAVLLKVANVEKVKIPKKGEQNGYTLAVEG